MLERLTPKPEVEGGEGVAGVMGVETEPEVLNEKDRNNFLASLAEKVKVGSLVTVTVIRSDGTRENDWRFVFFEDGHVYVRKTIKSGARDRSLNKEVPIGDFCIQNQDLITGWRREEQQVKATDRARLVELKKQIEEIDRAVGSGTWAGGLAEADRQVAELERNIRELEQSLVERFGRDPEDELKYQARMAEVDRLKKNLDERVLIRKEEEKRKKAREEALAKAKARAEAEAKKAKAEAKTTTTTAKGGEKGGEKATPATGSEETKPSAGPASTGGEKATEAPATAKGGEKATPATISKETKPSAGPASTGEKESRGARLAKTVNRSTEFIGRVFAKTLQFILPSHKTFEEKKPKK